MFDRTNLQVLANHARAAAENMAHTLHRTAHSAFVKETQDFTVMLMDRSGATFAVPMELGATWYPGLSYHRAIAMVDEYRPGRCVHQRSLFRPRCHARTRYASVEAGLRRRRDRRLDWRAYP